MTKQPLISVLVLFLLVYGVGYAQLATKKIKVADDIELIQLSDSVFVHVSYVEMQPYGKMPANGLLLISNGKAVLLDSPWNDAQTEVLVKFIKDSLHAKITDFVPNHWHADCMGGLGYLNKHGVKSYANQLTIDIAKEKGLPLPENGFKDSILLKVNNLKIDCYYLGGGHTIDNMVAWIPAEKILFAGCMVKAMAWKDIGNLSDADMNDYPVTIQKVIDKFPSAKIVIPGHGDFGGKELLTHTLELLGK